MNNKPFISIGMPTYNGADSIEKALDSLLLQSYDNFEIIISDNGSTDNTETICRKYSKKDKRIHYIRQSRNIGPVKNFDYVLQKAKGDYFMWAADDDIWHKNFIADLIFLYGFLEDDSIGLIAFQDKEKNKSKKYFAQKIDVLEYISYSDFIKNSYYNADIIYGLYKKQALLQARKESKILTIFWDIVTLSTLANKSRIIVINKKRFFYGKTENKYNIKTLEKLKTIILNSLHPKNILFIFSLIRPYFIHNYLLIKQSRNKKTSLLLQHILSSVFFLIFLLFNDIRILRKHEQTFYAKN